MVQTVKFRSTAICIGLTNSVLILLHTAYVHSTQVFPHFIFFSVENPYYDPLRDGVPGDDSGECSDELNNYYDLDEDESSLTTESDKLSLDLPSENASSASPGSFLSLLPEYAETRIATLCELEYLARSGLGKAVNQLDRLVQLYTEINEARQWITRGNNLNAPLSVEHIAEMDPVLCEETIKQLNAFLESREDNLVLKGNPGQFRKQFSDLLNSEMKVC